MQIRHIQDLSLFSALTPFEVEGLLNIAQVREYPAGRLLFLEGDAADRFSIILSGEIDIILSLGTPEERVLATLGGGNFLGEMGLLHPDQKRTASARVRTTSQHVEILKSDFDELINNQPAIAIRLAQEMSLRLRNSELAIIHDLQEKNQRLAQAYQELQEAQAQLIEKEKIEAELALARKIQENALLREMPIPAGWKIITRWLPARSVSGDFYDVMLQGDEKIKFLIADVAGKGVPAALVMATSRSVLRTLMAQDVRPAQVLESANAILFDETPENIFITCFYAEIELGSGQMRYANAGHCLPVCLQGHIQATGGLETLKASGMPLGALPGSRYTEKQARISPGDRVLLYSDGLIEAHNPAGELFGEPRMMEYLQTANLAMRKAGSDELINGLFSQVAEFGGASADQEDDLTVLLVERET